VETAESARRTNVLDRSRPRELAEGMPAVEAPSALWLLRGGLSRRV